jgi:hypothetical protein
VRFDMDLQDARQVNVGGAHPLALAKRPIGARPAYAYVHGLAPAGRGSHLENELERASASAITTSEASARPRRWCSPAPPICRS